jgi:hypothetical protein
VVILALRSMTGFICRGGAASLAGMETAEADAGVGLVRVVGFSTALTLLSRESTEDWIRSSAAMMAASIGSTGGVVRAGGASAYYALSRYRSQGRCRQNCHLIIGGMKGSCCSLIGFLLAFVELFHTRLQHLDRGLLDVH